MAGRENYRRQPNGTLYLMVAGAAFGHDGSRMWKGYWQRAAQVTRGIPPFAVRWPGTLGERNSMSDGEIILYQSEDGLSEIQLRAEGGTVWLSQAEISELFQTTPQNVTQHIKTLYGEGELVESATCKELLQVRLEGTRDVKRPIKFYNLEVILGVGYRVRSPRGTQFRQWATSRLREYLVKGFVIDDARLKSMERFDYFDELLEKIREIRASEKRFYQKIREVYATSVDYDSHSEAVLKLGFFGWMAGFRCDSKRLSKPVWRASCGHRPPGGNIAAMICVMEAT